MPKKLPPGWDLPTEFLDRLGESSGRQRAMLADDQLLLILHKMPSPEDISREGIFYWRTAEGEWKASNGQAGLPSLRAHIDEYVQAIVALEKDYEAANSAEEYFHLLERVVPIHRAAANMHATLQSARESMQSARELITLRDIAADVDRASEILQIDAKNALDYLVARRGEEQAKLANESAKANNRLSLIAALFLPLTAISGAFGMNIPNGLENSGPVLFWAVFIGGAVLGLLMGMMVGKSK